MTRAAVVPNVSVLERATSGNAAPSRMPLPASFHSAVAAAKSPNSLANVVAGPARSVSAAW